MSQKLDLYKEHADEYAAGAAPTFVQTRRAKYLTIAGEGDPGGKEFQDSIGALYASPSRSRWRSATRDTITTSQNWRGSGASLTNRVGVSGC